MAGEQSLPRYADFKKLIAENYPEVADRIAVNGNDVPLTRDAIEADIHRQLPGSVVAEIRDDDFFRTLRFFEANIKISQFLARGKPISDSTMQFSKIADMDERKSNFSYILINHEYFNARQNLHSYGDSGYQTPLMKFNEAALNGTALRWFVFFHELCHCLVRHGLHPSFPEGEADEIGKEYYRAREESICDSYATAMSVRILGKAAIPVLQAIADMRLSLFYKAGPGYFTAPAIEDVLRQIEDKGTDWLDALDREEVHDVAYRAGADHYISLDDFTACYPAYKGRDDINMANFTGLNSLYRREAYLSVFRPKLTAEKGTYDARIGEALVRSYTIISDKYLYASLSAMVKDRVFGIAPS